MADHYPYEIDELGSGRRGLSVGMSSEENPLDRILRELLAEDMQRFRATLEEALRPQVGYLTDTELHIYHRGKKLRPMMLLLSARLLKGVEEVSHKVIKASVSLEMLHVATLIHDDIIDNALLRRGLSSVYATRGVNTAILVGDLQFVQAIRCFVDAIQTDSEMGLVKLVLDTAFRICCGELDELHTDALAPTDRMKERYFEVIERKTAIMFGLACETGVALAGGHSSDARRIGFYGRRVGRAFQIMDDLLDFLQEEDRAGKAQRTDLSQRRMTLPVIYAMEELGDEHLVSQLMRGRVEMTPEMLLYADAAIRETGAFERSYADARHQAIDALEYLKPFRKSPYYSALEELALYTVDRHI